MTDERQDGRPTFAEMFAKAKESKVQQSNERFNEMMRKVADEARAKRSTNRR